MNTLRVNAIGPVLSLREREINYMLQNGFTCPGVTDVWTAQNLSAESASAALSRFEAEQVRTVPWLVELKTFCSEASVVGLRYVANVSASPFRRSVWVLLLLAGAAFTTFQIQDRMSYYWSYPVTVNIRVEHKDEMRFPTVTICNENRATRSAADALGNSSVTCVQRLNCHVFRS